MARVELNPALAIFRGEVGNLIFKMRWGRMYVSRKPDAKTRILSPAQKAAQVRFRQATVYAKQVMSDLERKTPYDLAAHERKTLTQNVIIADFLTAPSVDLIDARGYEGRPGGTIRIRASDDFEVAGVRVSISDGDGRTIEQGAATLSSMKCGLWVYAATESVPAGTRVRVQATATDGPGNTGMKAEEFVV